MYLGKRDFVDHITHVDPIGEYWARPPPVEVPTVAGWRSYSEGVLWEHKVKDKDHLTDMPRL